MFLVVPKLYGECQINHVVHVCSKVEILSHRFVSCVSPMLCLSVPPLAFCRPGLRRLFQKRMPRQPFHVGRAFMRTQNIVAVDNFFLLFLRQRNRLSLTTMSQTHWVMVNVREVDWRHGIRDGGLRHVLSDDRVSDDQQCYDDDQQNALLHHHLPVHLSVFTRCLPPLCHKQNNVE